MQAQQIFGVIAAGLVFRLDVQHSKLARVGPAFQIEPSGNVSVIPVRACRTHNKGISLGSLGRNERRAFFCRPINLGRDKQAMPVH